MRITINGNDLSRYVIVRGFDTISAEHTAIDEFLHFTETDLPVYMTSDNPYQIVIRTDEKYGYDGFRIHTDGDKLYITGGRPRGVLYGVYEFLESYIGWRFLTASHSYRIGADTIDLRDIDDEQIPVLEYRDVYWYPYFKSRIAARRKVNSANTRDIPESLGGSVGYTGGFVHTFGTLVGCDWHLQPCLSDPEILDKTIESVKKILVRSPNAKLISVSQNDNVNYCKCDKCTAIDEEEGSHAGTMIRFVNAVADAFAYDYPKLGIHTLAYQYTRKAPKLTKPRDNVVVQLCTIECCFNHSLNDDSCELNRALKQDMEEWAKICNRIYIWDYTTNFAHYIATFPNFHVIADNVRFFCDNHSKGIFEQGNYQGTGGEFSELRSYLLAKLLWNPYISEEEYYRHMDEFLAGYYGAGWKYIRKFIDYITKSAKKIPHFGIYAHPTKMLNADDFIGNNEIDEWFDNAEKMADPMAIDNVKRVRLQYKYFKLGIEFEKYNNSDREAFRDELVHYEIKKSESRNRSCIDVDVAKSPFDW